MLNVFIFRKSRTSKLELAGEKLEHGRRAKGLGPILFGEQKKKKPRRKSDGHSQRG